MICALPTFIQVSLQQQQQQQQQDAKEFLFSVYVLCPTVPTFNFFFPYSSWVSQILLFLLRATTY